MTNKMKSMTVRPRGIIIPDKFFAGSDCIQGGTRDTVAWSWAALRREEINWWKRSHFQFSRQPGRSMLNANQPRRRRLSSYFPLLLRIVRDQPWIGGHLHAYQPLDQGNLSFLCSILCPPRPMKGWTLLPCLITTHWILGCGDHSQSWPSSFSSRFAPVLIKTRSIEEIQVSRRRLINHWAPGQSPLAVKALIKLIKSIQVIQSSRRHWTPKPLSLVSSSLW